MKLNIKKKKKRKEKTRTGKERGEEGNGFIKNTHTSEK
jgi:hypothetical protein